MGKWVSAGLAGAIFVAGVLLGTAGGPGRVAAQGANPFIVGDTISLQYNGAPSRECRVEAIAGDFVKCRHPQDQVWYNMTATLLVVRCSPLATPGCK